MATDDPTETRQSRISESFPASPQAAASSRPTRDDQRLRAARTLGAYILGGSGLLGAAIVLAAVVVRGVPDLPAGIPYLLFLAVVFVAYLIYQRVVRNA